MSDGSIGRKTAWPNRSTTATFACEGPKASYKELRIIGVVAEIRTKHLPNSSLELYALAIQPVQPLVGRSRNRDRFPAGDSVKTSFGAKHHILWVLKFLVGIKWPGREAD
jgi:hypothetical protein